MRRLMVTLFFLLVPSALRAWDGVDHQLMSRLALEEVAEEWGLNDPLEVRPLRSFLDKLTSIHPDLGEPAAFSRFLKINPTIDLEAEDPNVAGRPTLSPLLILSFYSTDPDDGRDQNLPTTSPDQKWFGDAVGPDSQAFRHIEKPPFSLRHPLRTFGFPFRAVGEATLRAEIYFQLSELAFALGEEYWGWRFLAGGFHHLQDLHQPYHAGQITLGLLARGLWAYLSWGHDEKGLLPTLSHVVSNSHRFYESYISQSSTRDLLSKRKALEALRGRDFIEPSGSIRDLAIQARDSSNVHFAWLICAVTRISDPILFSEYDFKSDQEGADDPSQFLKGGKGFEAANQKILAITGDRFRSAGRILRTVVWKSRQEREKRQTPEEILQRLEKLI